MYKIVFNCDRNKWEVRWRWNRFKLKFRRKKRFKTEAEARDWVTAQL